MTVDGKMTSKFGQWSDEEIKYQNINFLEIKAALYTLRSFGTEIRGCTVDLQVDNMCAVAAINRMGNMSKLCDTATKEIWDWDNQQEFWIVTSHIAGIDNVVADEASRKTHNHYIEWSLTQSVYDDIVNRLDCIPGIDLFASRMNYKVKPFYSYRPDPQAEGHDAFSKSWRGRIFYAFPPIIMIAKVLRKVQRDVCSGIIIVPMWETQPRFPTLIAMLVRKPIYISSAPSCLFNPLVAGGHPLKERLKLAACRISASGPRTEAYQRERSD